MKKSQPLLNKIIDTVINVTATIRQALLLDSEISRLLIDFRIVKNIENNKYGNNKKRVIKIPIVIDGSTETMCITLPNFFASFIASFNVNVRMNSSL